MRRKSRASELATWGRIFGARTWCASIEARGIKQFPGSHQTCSVVVVSAFEYISNQSK